MLVFEGATSLRATVPVGFRFGTGGMARVGGSRVRVVSLHRERTSAVGGSRVIRGMVPLVRTSFGALPVLGVRCEVMVSLLCGRRLPMVPAVIVPSRRGANLILLSVLMGSFRTVVVWGCVAFVVVRRALVLGGTLSNARGLGAISSGIGGRFAVAIVERSGRHESEEESESGSGLERNHNER